MTTCGFSWCLSVWLACVRGDVSSHAAARGVTFVSALKDALKDERDLSISQQFRKALLWDKQDDFSSVDSGTVTNGETVTTNDESDSRDPPFLLKGLPRRPLYTELGNRLCLLSSHKVKDIPLLLPAEHFGLSENAMVSAMSSSGPNKAVHERLDQSSWDTRNSVYIGHAFYCWDRSSWLVATIMERFVGGCCSTTQQPKEPLERGGTSSRQTCSSRPRTVLWDSHGSC